jgi:hypothetical protein
MNLVMTASWWGIGRNPGARESGAPGTSGSRAAARKRSLVGSPPGALARFDARAPPAVPAHPAFYGSFS